MMPTPVNPELAILLQEWQDNVVVSSETPFNNCKAENSADRPETHYKAVIIVLKVLPMFLIVCGALIGNVLVILSVLTFWKLRQSITNFFILSLAFADLLVALIVMPFNAMIIINAGRWLLGRWMCDIYNSNDVLFSTASIIHLVCISIDRYIAIVYPFLYENIITRRRAYLMIAATWILSILISYVPIFTGIYTTTEHLKTKTDKFETCTFITNPSYALVSSFVSFWVPCITLCSLYRRVFVEANRQVGKLRRHNACRKEEVSTSPEVKNSLAEHNPRFHQLYSIINKDALTSVIKPRGSEIRERRAAKILGLVVGCFILCWLPFFTWYTIINICGQNRCYTPDILVDIFFWCGYLNSLANPLIYSYCNTEFRKAFRYLLRYCVKRRRPVRWSLESNVCYMANTNTEVFVQQRRISRARNLIRTNESESSLNYQGRLSLMVLEPREDRSPDS